MRREKEGINLVTVTDDVSLCSRQGLGAVRCWLREVSRER